MRDLTDQNEESRQDNSHKVLESDDAKERFQVDLVQLSDYLHLEEGTYVIVLII